MEVDNNIKTELGVVDKRILKILGKGDNQTTYQISKKAKIGWSTAKIHCMKLKDEGYVSKHTHVFYGGNKKDFWSIVKNNPPEDNQNEREVDNE